MLLWHPHSEIPELLPYLDLYHGGLNHLWSWPDLSRTGNQVKLGPKNRRVLNERRPAEILLFGLSQAGFRQAEGALAPYSTSFDRSTEISSGPIHLYLWLLTLRKFERPPGS